MYVVTLDTFVNKISINLLRPSRFVNSQLSNTMNARFYLFGNFYITWHTKGTPIIRNTCYSVVLQHNIDIKTKKKFPAAHNWIFHQI